ncbi:UrcA family protein [Sphingobium sp. OAS761]|uniref:UrcA family protein n=1 Tax=Sphingobium sp. OAS761 TaxID=2817901 RepID=UPI0020A151E8|nr:UrcA family protein [Sphingobium sp. OAS761]MCP1469953.1 UrcA family protein [Sphingobium sp. OAS761]
MLNRIVIAAGAVALALPMAAPVQAQVDGLTVTARPGAPEVRAKLVRLGDLDLRSDRGVRVADARIRRAAEDVCGVGRMNGSVIRAGESRCYADAFGRARVDLNGAISDQRLG